MENLITDIHQNCSEAIAKLIKMGKIIADIQELLSRYGASNLCPGLCVNSLLQVTDSEALQLTRWAADRPTWSDPAAVDLADPLASELLQQALLQVLREVPNEFAQEVA
jgi:hypothetical protein